MKKHPTTNNQYRASNVLFASVGCWSLDVSCWMLSNSCFTPCKPPIWLIEPKTDAAEIAARKAVILLSPARSSIDEFQNARKSGEKLYSRAESISWGKHTATPNINGQMIETSQQRVGGSGKDNFSLRGFLRKKHEANDPITSTSLQKGRHSAKDNE